MVCRPCRLCKSARHTVLLYLIITFTPSSSAGPLVSATSMPARYSERLTENHKLLGSAFNCALFGVLSVQVCESKKTLITSPYHSKVTSALLHLRFEGCAAAAGDSTCCVRSRRTSVDTHHPGYLSCVRFWWDGGEESSETFRCQHFVVECTGVDWTRWAHPFMMKATYSYFKKIVTFICQGLFAYRIWVLSMGRLLFKIAFFTICMVSYPSLSTSSALTTQGRAVWSNSPRLLYLQLR